MKSIHRHAARIAQVMVFVWLAMTAGIAIAAPSDADHPLVGRFAGSEMVGHFVTNFDEVEVMDGPILNGLRDPGAEGWQKLEGKIQLFYYKLPEGSSSLEVLRNYEASLKANGFSTMFSCATSDSSCYMKQSGHAANTAPYDFAIALDAAPELPRYKGDYIRNYFSTNARYLLARLDRAGGRVYASIAIAEGNRERLAIVRVIETKAMETGKIAFVGAEQMRDAIADTGHIAVYGLQFDFDKDIVKPDSKTTLDEIAKLLAGDPSMRLAVVGHTDARGGEQYNRDLSQRRAVAVVAALTREYGIAASRLQPRGAGSSEPLASNDTDEGRTRNRRVELVRL